MFDSGELEGDTTFIRPQNTAVEEVLPTPPVDQTQARLGVEGRELTSKRYILIVNLHPYEDVELTARALNSVITNLQATHPDGEIVISVIDDSKTKKARDAIRALTEKANNAMTVESGSYSAEYLQANGNEFLNALVSKLAAHGISEKSLKLLLSTDIRAGYVGYTGSINQGVLRALYLAGKRNIPRNQAMIFHMDQDEMLRAYNPPNNGESTQYQSEQRDFLGQRLDALRQGRQIVGAQYAVHPGSLSSMLSDITKYMQLGLEFYLQDPANLDRLISMPISISQDGENYSITYLTVREFFETLPQVINASYQRTPVVGYKTESDFISRDTSHDKAEAPVSRTIRLDTASRLFDPHNRGMHEIIHFLGLRAMIDDDDAIVKTNPHIHHRSANFGNQLEGQHIFDAVHPHSVQYVYAVGSLTHEQLAANFQGAELDIIKRVRENLNPAVARKILAKLEKTEQIVLGLKEKLPGLVVFDPSLKEGVEAIRGFVNGFEQFYTGLKPQLQEPVDTDKLLRDIKRYFKYQKLWEQVCDLAYELGVEEYGRN